MKLCKDCEHFYYGLHFPLCSIAFERRVYDPIFGERRVVFNRTCERAREDNALCGESASFFAPRQPKKSILQRLKVSRFFLR